LVILIHFSLSFNFNIALIEVGSTEAGLAKSIWNAGELDSLN